MYLTLLNGLFLLRYGVGRQGGQAQALYWLVLTALFLFSAFRFRVGCDWSGYFYNFLGGRYYTYATALQEREPLWWVIQVAVNDLGLPYPTVNVLTSAIFFAGIHVLARRQPDRLGFLVMLFPILIINMPMSGIRQAAAIGFLCLSLVAFLDHRPIRFVVWILVGSTIHSSVLAFLLLTPLATGRYTTARIAMTLLLALPAAAVMLQTDNAQLAISRYVDTGIDAFGAMFRVAMLSLTGAMFFIFLRKTWARQFPQDYGLVSIGAWMMLALMPMVPISSVIGDRLGYYLIPIQTMIFARVPFLALGSGRRLMSVLPYLGLLLVFAVWSARSTHFQSCYLPYQTWLFGVDGFGVTGF